MRKTKYVLLAAFVLPLADPSFAEKTAETGRLPTRGSGGALVNATVPALVPVNVPGEARPPVQTAIAEKIGAEGIAAFRSGNFAGAREAYLRVLKIEPDNLPALVNLGSTEYRLGNSREGERLLRRSLQIKPDNPTAWLNLGIIYLERDEPMRSLAAIAQAVAQDPNDAVTRNYLGVAAGRNRWFDAAESELRCAFQPCCLLPGAQSAGRRIGPAPLPESPRTRRRSGSADRKSSEMRPVPWCARSSG
jgi:tetratricopeptide (TPR) repeat protein